MDLDTCTTKYARYYSITGIMDSHILYYNIQIGYLGYTGLKLWICILYNNIKIWYLVLLLRDFVIPVLHENMLLMPLDKRDSLVEINFPVSNSSFQYNSVYIKKTNQHLTTFCWFRWW